MYFSILLLQQFIPHDGLKECIRKKIKDKDFLIILDEIIDSTDNVRDISSKLTNKIGIGVPIGNYLSQYFANLYLSELDHLCKEELKCKFYYRYADDIVILSHDKDFLHKVLIYIKLYVHTIGLKVKDNYQIYPVDSRGINFVGYVFYHTHTLIRKSIKYKIIRLVNSYLNREIDKKEFKVRMCAYYGWLKHADAKNLLYKIQSLTGVRYSNWNGKRTNITKYYGKYVRIIQIINYAKYFRINFIRNGKAYYADSRDKTLFYSIHRFNHFPINFKIIKYDWRIYAKNRKEKVKLKTQYIMTKDKLKDDIIRTICCLNSDISNKDRKLLIELLNSIVDYTNNTELEQDVKVIEQKHNELAETVNELKTKVETYSNKINELEQRVHQLENASQS